ncbi:MAG: histidinol-phosphatase [Thermoproteota archaeon]
MRVNYHIHTVFSDGASVPEEYCRLAAEKSFDEIAFTDHLTILPNGSTVLGSLNNKTMEKYVDKVREVSRMYSGRIRVRLGLEADYVSGNERFLEYFLRSYDFDLVIGSVHFLGELCIDSPRERHIVEQEVARIGFDKFYSKYLSVVDRAVETGFFDIIGHMDLVRIWGFKPGDGYLEEQNVLSRISEQGMCLEVSSRGLRQPVKAIYPSPRILKRACELSIPVTIGTDAHNVSELDYAYDDLVKYIRGSGYSKITLFEKRRMVEEDI